jgi:hypothetical protein
MSSRRQRDEMERILGDCSEDTYCRVILDAAEAKALGVRIGTVIRERIPAEFVPVGC